MRIIPGETFNSCAICANATRPSWRSASMMTRSILSSNGERGLYLLFSMLYTNHAMLPECRPELCLIVCAMRGVRRNSPFEHIFDHQRHNRCLRLAHARRLADHFSHKAVYFRRIASLHLKADVCLADRTCHIADVIILSHFSGHF